MNSPTILSGEITAMELHHWLDRGKPLMLLNVMDANCHGESHIPGSARACVYETAFLDEVRQLNTDTGASVVVYGTGADSLASRVAAEKLRSAGFTHVYDLRGGLREWQSEGYEINAAASPSTEPAPLDGRFVLDLEKSVVRWTGKNLLNHHEGTLRLSAGEVVLEDGSLVRAEFTMDMRTLACADLTDATWNQKLLAHLMDADFFDAANWPQATFVTTSATEIPESTPGLPNYEITGQLSVRGRKQELGFTAAIGSPDGLSLGGQAELEWDRTCWGAIYGSGKFFDRLGQHLVNDFVHLHLKIVATKTAA